MVNVPYSEGVADVAPQSGGTGATYGDVPQANAAAFGGGIGEAEQGVGQQANQLAQKFADIYNESTARDAATKTAQDMSDAENRFHQLKGNDAVAGLKPFQDEIASIAKNNADGLSLNANSMYQRDAASLVNNATFRVGAHVGEQAEKAQTDSLNASIATNINQFAMNATNPTGASYLSKIQDDALSYAHHMGVTDSNVADQMVSHNYGEAFAAAIKTNLQSNPDVAQKLWNQASNGVITKPDGTTVPYLDAEHRASISSEMEGEFRRQAQNTLWDASSVASTGDQYDKSAVAGAMQRAGYSSADIAAHITHLDNVQQSFGSADARYTVGKALDNDAALAYAGKSPIGVYDSATLQKAFPKDPDKVQDILNQVNQLHQVAGFVGGMSTRTPAQNQAALDAFAPQGMSIADAIHQQESGGKANAPANGISVGGWQVTPGTFAQYAKPGEDINNPKDNEAVGRRIIDDLSKKFNGDPARIAVGYFSGAGNVAPAGSATPWINDTSDKNGKTVSSYVADVTGRMSGSPNFGEQSDLQAKMQKAATDYYKKLNDDPAGVITGNDSKLNTTFADAVQDTKNPQKMVDYVNAVAARQEALQIPEENRSVLPKAYAASITNNLIQNPEQAPVQLAKMANDYGNTWPSVYKSLVQQGGLPPAYQIVQQLGADPNTEKYGTMLARYFGSDDTKGKTDEVLMGGAKSLKTLNESVAGNTDVLSLTNSLARSGASPTQVAGTVGSIQKLAMAIHFYDPSDSNPAATAIKAMTSKYAYLPDGGARVPIDKLDTVSNNTQVALDDIETKMSPAQFVPNTYANRQQYIDDVKSSPSWVTRGADNKVYLYDQFGRAVMGTDGKQIGVGFDDPIMPNRRTQESPELREFQQSQEGSTPDVTQPGSISSALSSNVTGIEPSPSQYQGRGEIPRPGSLADKLSGIF